MRKLSVRHCCGVVVIGLSVYAAAAAEPGVCIVDGARTATVVLPADLRGGDAYYAAFEISAYVGKITGRELTVVAEGCGVWGRKGRNRRLIPFDELPARPASDVEIHVGWTERLTGAVDRAAIEKLDIDGFVIKIEPTAVYLIGRKGWSTAYACFTFLEAFCDVRWYLPGELGEDVPRRDTLYVPRIDKVYEPAYRHRQYSGFQWRNQRELQRWGAHRKVRARLQYHHNLCRVFDVAKYGKQCPDLYPILGGKRRVPGVGNVAGWQPCLTHPKAVELAVEYAKDYFAKNPDAASISLGINDGGQYCECDRCMKVVDESLGEDRQRAPWFFAFANAVAARFDELFPNKVIGYLLYGQCHLPEGMKIHRRLIGFEVFPSYRLILPEAKAEYDERLAQIAESCPTFALYDWFYGDGLVVPRLQIRQAKYWLEHGYEMGARHVKAEAYMNWGLDGFKYWMHAKLMWDPSLDVDEMMDEFFPRYFRAAAAPMREYYRVVEEYSVRPVMKSFEIDEGEVMRPINFRFRYPEQFESFPPGAVEACEPLLDEAEKRAESYIVRERVRYCRAAFEVAKMMTTRYHLTRDAIPLLGEPGTLARGMPLLARALSRDLDVDQYYAWVLRGDDFCVRYPEHSMFGGVTLARSTAASTLGQQIIAELRKIRPRQLTADTISRTVDRTLTAALAQIPDSDARNAAQVAVGPFARKIVLCKRARAPGIDGRLDDACWRDAEACSDFAAIGTGRSATYRTEARVAYDGKTMYGAYRCFQDPSLLLAWTVARDGRVWREDGIEFLLNRPDDTSKDQNFQIIANTQGNIYDSYLGDSKWDGDIRIATAVEPDSYTVEFSVPLAQIGIDPARDRFLRVNMVRNVYARKTLHTGREKEISSWYLAHFGNLDPRARGWLVFGK